MGGSGQGAETLAAALVPLRTALREWPVAAELPPYGVLLGCFQALLRGQLEQLERLRTRLDEGRAQALAEVERRAAMDEEIGQLEAWTRGEFADEEPPAKQETAEAQIARVAEQAMTAAKEVLAADGGTRAALATQADEAAAYYAEGEEPGSPYDELAMFLRAVAARLRDVLYEPEAFRAPQTTAQATEAAPTGAHTRGDLVRATRLRRTQRAGLA